MASPDPTDWATRNSPPIDPQLGAATLFTPEAPREGGFTFPNTGWEEPPLRPPQPSFMDHGGERVGVLEGMMPLGSYPSAKVRARAKADPLRRAMHARTQEGALSDDLRTTPGGEGNTGENTRATSVLVDEHSRQESPVAHGRSNALQQDTPILPMAPENEFPDEQDMAQLPPQDQSPVPPLQPPPPAPLSYPSTPVFHPPPGQPFMGHTFQIHQPPLPTSTVHPIHRFHHAINLAIYKRPDYHAVVDAILAAATKDPEFKHLLAAHAERQSVTAEQRTALNKKVRRLKKAWHQGRAAIQNSTCGKVEQQNSPDSHLQAPSRRQQLQQTQEIMTSQSPENEMLTSPSPNLTRALEEPHVADAYPPDPQPPSKNEKSSSGPVLKLRLTRGHPSPAPLQPAHSSTLQPPSPLRQTSNIDDHLGFTINRSPSHLQPVAGKDSDLSSVDEAITNQDQATFIDMGGPRTRGQAKKRPASETPHPEQNPSKRHQASAPSFEGSGSDADFTLDVKRSIYNSNVITQDDKNIQALITDSEIRPVLNGDPYRTPPLIDPAADGESVGSKSSSELSEPPADLPLNAALSPTTLKLKAPLAHLDDQSPSSNNVDDTDIPTALGRPKKIKTPKIKTPLKENRFRRAVLAGKPELHENNKNHNRDSNLPGRPSSSSASSENSDYCAACGGDGYLICCDGANCKRSFHFNCVDPPLRDPQLSDSWYCDSCQKKQQPQQQSQRQDRPEDTLWGPLLNALENKTPQAYALPASIRSHYPNVTTTAGGEYSESTVPERSGNRGKASELKADPPYEYFRIHDATTGKRLICHACHLGARHPDRQIVTCDYCDEPWHPECLDPPRAHHPHKYIGEGKFRQSWMCPLHVAQDLAHIDANAPDAGVRPERPTHRLRVPKDVRTVKSAMIGGVPNNGNIDIVFTGEDYVDGPARKYQRRQEDNSVQYQLTDQEVVLDFIHKVKANDVFEQKRKYKDALDSHCKASKVQKKLDRQKLKNAKMLGGKLTTYYNNEQQAALRLVQLATGQNELDLGGGKLDNLLKTALAEAPEGAVDSNTSIVKGKVNENIDPMDLNDEQVAQLEKIQEKIAATLAKAKTKRRWSKGKAKANA